MSRAGRRNSLSVLVIDERVPVLVLISSVVEANGMRALRARSAAEALEIARRDFVPVDLLLVGGSGSDSTLYDSVFETVSEIRRMRPAVQVLGLSAVDADEVIRLYLEGTDYTNWDRGAGLVDSIRTACGVSAGVRHVKAAGHPLF